MCSICVAYRRCLDKRAEFVEEFAKTHPRLAKRSIPFSFPPPYLSFLMHACKIVGPGPHFPLQ